MSGFMSVFGLWMAVFFTFSIFSFLYKDNPFYKFGEQVFVGLSAAYWLVYLFYSIMPVSYTHLTLPTNREV